MSKQQKQIIFLAVLGVIIVVLFIRFLTSSSTPPAATKKASTAYSAPKNDKAKAASSPASEKKAQAPKGKGKPEAGTSTDTTEADASAIKHTDIDIDQLLAGIKEVDFEYDPAEIPRDPMRPLIGTVTATQEEAGDPVVVPASANRVREKVVSGIVWSERAPVAIVDNEIVTPGYVYPDGTGVESIGPDRVVFKVAESLIQVELKEP